MTSHVTQDIRLLYEAVYDQDLREKADEYNYQVRDEDIVEVATEYFYTYGLNSDGVDILIEKVGLDNFVEFVYDLSEDYVVLDEAKKKYVSHLARSRQETKQKAAKAAQERKDDEKKPESRGADTEAKEEQPKSKKPVRDAIARNIFRAVDAYKSGMERHRQATQTAGRLAGETARTVGKVVSTTHEAGRRAGEHVKKHGLKSLANEEFEYWVNSLIEEGYDLSDYTWDDMYEYYVQKLDEGEKLLPIVEGYVPYEGKPRRKLLGKEAKLMFQIHPEFGGGFEVEKEKRLRRLQKVHDRMSKQTNEQVDLYDIILSHLLDEGYADTNEDALAIMANMSEEWRENIVELYQGRHGQSETQYQDSRSNAGKMVSGTSRLSGAAYSSRATENTGPNPAGGSTRPQGQGRMTTGQRTEMQYRKAILRRGSSSLSNVGRGVEASPSGLRFRPGTGGNFGISGIGLAN